MLKLTRLNRSIVAINPDHISWVDASPDTTLCLIGGDKLIVRESLDELIDKVIAYRRLVHDVPGMQSAAAAVAHSVVPRSVRSSLRPPTHAPVSLSREEK